MYRSLKPRGWLFFRGVALLGVVFGMGCGQPDRVVLGRGTSPFDAGGSDLGDPGRVTGFVLVDVTTGLDRLELANGDTISLAGAPVTIRAVTAPPVVGSVVFAVDGLVVRTEENPPWAIAGNDKQTGHYYTWTIAVGTHLIAATPHSAHAGSGVAGVALEQTFQIQ
jgi:hypothetical protein